MADTAPAPLERVDCQEGLVLWNPTPNADQDGKLRTGVILSGEGHITGFVTGWPREEAEEVNKGFTTPEFAEKYGLHLIKDPAGNTHVTADDRVLAITPLSEYSEQTSMPLNAFLAGNILPERETARVSAAIDSAQAKLDAEMKRAAHQAARHEQTGEQSRESAQRLAELDGITALLRGMQAAQRISSTDIRKCYAVMDPVLITGLNAHARAILASISNTPAAPKADIESPPPPPPPNQR